MSGNSFFPWNDKDAIKMSMNIRAELGCSGTTTRAALDCLRAKSVQELLHAFGRHSKVSKAADATKKWWVISCSPQEDGLAVLPVVDDFLPERDRYLPSDPYEALRNGSYLQIPLIIGISDFANDYCKLPTYFLD